MADFFFFNTVPIDISEHYVRADVEYHTSISAFQMEGWPRRGCFAEFQCNFTFQDTSKSAFQAHWKNGGSVPVVRYIPTHTLAGLDIWADPWHDVTLLDSSSAHFTFRVRVNTSDNDNYTCIVSDNTGKDLAPSSPLPLIATGKSRLL